MGANSFNAMELDAIGEIMNISLGASATAVSTLLGTKVNITTPVAQVLSSDEFSFKRMEPAVGVNISYVKGLEGNNVMIFRRNDVRVIVGILMGAEIPEEEFVMDDEINVSAVCEVMNQMMGSSATALSEFLGYPVDISTPKSFEIRDDISFKERYFPSGTTQVLVRFTLEIGDVLKSEFMNIMSIDLIKRLLAPFADTLQSADEEAVQQAVEPESSLIQTNLSEESVQAESKMPDGVLSQEEIQAMLAKDQEKESASGGGDAMLSQEEIQAMLAGNQTEEPAVSASSGGDATLSQEEIQAMLAGVQSEPAPRPEPTPAPQPAPMPVQQPVYQQAPAAMDPMMMQLMTQMQQSQMQMMEMMNQMRTEKPAQVEGMRPNTVVHPVNSPKFAEDTSDGVEEAANKELLMKVPLEISVEIGRTRKLVKDILEFTQGSLVVLDKMAGERADVFVNGECIARGDIVVVEDNFGIRITEIVSRNLNPEAL
ncbi:MAG: flagellar motor switch protein FliN [Lachnospiraceae bacterium]|jgi:flagellar motor switch protein FliN/FliY|nr:flagellar motor switch protein FliN [Lachnospiraceae bacterium]